MGAVNAVFLAVMEKVLALYSLAYDAKYPVLCFDERPCFLIGDLIEPLSMQSGSVRKEHYQYEKNGSCSLLLAIEPKTGKRIAEVYERRTMQEYTLFMKKVADAFPEAVKIRLVQDNLNTHNTGSFYASLDAEEAFALSERFEFFYTPKSASWLNMAEIEFSALAKQCLHRRIPTLEKLRTEVLALVKERAEKQLKIDWQFSIQGARTKLNKSYSKVNSGNLKFENT